MRQLNMKAITNAVTVSARFCTIVDRRSARALLTKVASAAKIDVSVPVLFSSRSNQPTSLERIAAVEESHGVIRMNDYMSNMFLVGKLS